MEPRNDRTWLLVGVGVGCFFVVICMLCLGSVACFSCSAPYGSDPIPQQPPSPPYVLPTVVPPTVVPPPVTLPPPPLPDPSEESPPLSVHATITSVTGTPGVAVGQTCEFHVERRDRDDGSGFWCNSQVVCGGHALYGGPNAGFFPCTLFYAPTRGVVGADPNTTATDEDAALSIDSGQQHLEVWDDARGPNGEFRVVAHIDTLE
jgi:hypothetical protein